MRLASPQWLALTALIVVLIALWTMRRRWLRYPFPVERGRGRAGRPLRWAGLATSLSGAVAAVALAPIAVGLARPQEVLSKSIETAEGVDLAVVLDVSGSMAALDFQPTDRLGVAKQVIGDFLDQRPHDRISLVIFAGAAVTLCPLTLDHEMAGRMLDSVKMGVLPDGTAIGMGLGTAVSRLRSSKAKSKVIVLVTDGSNNAGQLDPLTAADLAAEEHIVVHTVLVGRGGRVPIPVPVRDPLTGQVRTTIQQVEVETNPQLLAEIARRTGGSSFTAKDADALRKVFGEIDALEKTEFTSTHLERYREKFEPWALAAFILLLAAAGLEGTAGRTPW